jgi:hypothetical protein
VLPVRAAFISGDLVKWRGCSAPSDSTRACFGANGKGGDHRHLQNALHLTRWIRTLVNEQHADVTDALLQRAHPALCCLQAAQGVADHHEHGVGLLGQNPGGPERSAAAEVDEDVVAALGLDAAEHLREDLPDLTEARRL